MEVNVLREVTHEFDSINQFQMRTEGWCQKSDNFADIINGSPLRQISPDQIAILTS